MTAEPIRASAVLCELLRAMRNPRAKHVLSIVAEYRSGKMRDSAPEAWVKEWTLADYRFVRALRAAEQVWADET